VLEVSDHFGDRRRRDAELGASFRHAAVFHYGEEDEQVAQPHAAADLLFPLDEPRHKVIT